MMYSLLLISFVFFVAASGTARGDADCTAEVFNGWSCCKIEGLNANYKKENVEKCVRKYFGGNPSPSELKNARVCAAECILSEEGVLTDDNKLDRQAITKLLSSYDEVLRPVVHAAIDKCFGTYEAELDSSLECKSGADEFSGCLAREGFLNCHSSFWTSSPECEELKVNVTKCPKIPVILGMGRVKLFQ